MSVYTVRVTEENNQFICWIDKDNEICVKQPFDHEISGDAFFTTRESAQAYGDKWAAIYTQMDIDAQAAEIERAEARKSLVAKLSALGLTEREIEVLNKPVF